MTVVFIHHVFEIFVGLYGNQRVEVFGEDLVFEYDVALRYFCEFLVEFGECDVWRNGDDASLSADVFEKAVGRSREDFATKAGHELHFITPRRSLSLGHFCRQDLFRIVFLFVKLNRKYQRNAKIETPFNMFKKIDAPASSFFGLIKNVEIDVKMQ